MPPLSSRSPAQISRPGPVESGYVAHQLLAGVYDSIPSLRPGPGDADRAREVLGLLNADGGRAWALALARRARRMGPGRMDGVIGGLKQHSFETGSHLVRRSLSHHATSSSTFGGRLETIGLSISHCSSPGCPLVPPRIQLTPEPHPLHDRRNPRPPPCARRRPPRLGPFLVQIRLIPQWTRHRLRTRVLLRPPPNSDGARGRARPRHRPLVQARVLPLGRPHQVREMWRPNGRSTRRRAHRRG